MLTLMKLDFEGVDMFNLLTFVDGTYLLPVWFVNALPIYRSVLMCLIAVGAIAIIVSVLMLNTTSSGASAITGISDTYYSQNKGSTKEGRLKRLIAISAITIVVLIVLFFVPELFYGG